MRYRELNQEGVGLGLTISKNLAVAMGGNVTIVSEIGVGTTFTIQLPILDIISTTTIHRSPNNLMRGSGPSRMTALINTLQS